MRRVLALSVPTLAVLIAAGACAGAASAQTAEGAGLRYLSWPGKANAPAAVQPRASAPAPASPVPLARLAQPAAAPTSPRRNLTPASAFYAPAPAAALVPSAPQPPAEPAVETVAASPPVEAAPTPVPAPADLPADPMAPRRDAPIFRLQPQGAAAPAPAPAETAAPQTTAPVQTAQAAPEPYGQPVRYYSVHRQAGRQPDAIPAPRQIWLDALPVEMTQAPASADLAEPDAPPALVRQADGTVRALPQAQADDLP